MDGWWLEMGNSFFIRVDEMKCAGRASVTLDDEAVRLFFVC